MGTLSIQVDLGPVITQQVRGKIDGVKMTGTVRSLYITPGYNTDLDKTVNDVVATIEFYKGIIGTVINFNGKSLKDLSKLLA